MTNPKVSVMMVNYNNAAFIGEAIESVLRQTYTNFELIIIDESTDDSVNIINKYVADKRVKLITSKSRSGITRSRNTALRHCSGKYIAIADSDDISMPVRLKKQVDYLEKHPEIGVVGSNFYYIDRDSNNTKKAPTSHSGTMSDGRVCVHNPTCMIRRTIFRHFGKYNTQYPISDDVEFFYRIWNRGVKFHRMSEYLIKYRRIRGNNTSDVRNEARVWACLKVNIKNIFIYRSPFSIKGYLFVGEQIMYLLKLKLAKLFDHVFVLR